MKKILKLLWVFLKVFAILIFIGIIMNIIIFVLNLNKPILGDNRYDSIYELNSAKAEAIYSAGDGSTDFFVKDIAFSVKVEDKWFVFCPYSRDIDGETVEDTLYFYTVREEDGMFILETSATGFGGKWGKLSLDSNYEKYDSEDSSAKCELNGQKNIITFAYKDISENKKIYLDGTEMSEIEVENSATGDKFILCYHISSDKGNILSDFFVSFFQTAPKKQLELK